MNIKNTVMQYGLVARLLHWTSVALLLTLVVIASQFEDLLPSPEKAKLIALHASLGLAFFLIMIARLTWRNRNHNPIHSYSINRWQKYAAIGLHRSIYVVMLTQCIVGSIMLISAGEVIQIFNLFELAPLIEKQERLNHLMLNMHYFISVLIYPLLALHISAAIYHQIFGVVED